MSTLTRLVDGWKASRSECLTVHGSSAQVLTPIALLDRVYVEQAVKKKRKPPVRRTYVRPAHLAALARQLETIQEEAAVTTFETKPVSGDASQAPTVQVGPPPAPAPARELEPDVDALRPTMAPPAPVATCGQSTITDPEEKVLDPAAAVPSPVPIVTLPFSSTIVPGNGFPFTVRTLPCLRV